MKKKRLLLAILPSLLILSSCNVGALNDKAENHIFLEDSLAHEEVFGGSKILQPRKTVDPDPVVHPDSDPAIGIQSFVSGGNVSFRFVATVRFSDSQLEPTKAVWTKSVCSPTGEAFSEKFNKGTYECSKAYTKLNSGGSIYTIDQYNEAHGLTGDSCFTHFVVYTLRNIPVATYGNYYVSAYLNLSGEGGVNQTTKAIAIRVDQEEKYTYVHNAGAYFITGSFTSDPIMATGVRVGGNSANFEGVLALNAGDSFVINEFYESKFIVHGASELEGKSTYFFEADGDGSIKAKYNGNYDFYLKYEDARNKLFAEEHDVSISRKVYIKLDGSCAAWSTSNQIVIYAFGGAGDANKKWFSTTAVSGGFVTDLEVNPALYQNIIVVEIKEGCELDWGNIAGSEADHRQSDDFGFPSVPYFDGASPKLAVKVYHREYSGGKNWWGCSWEVF